MVETLIAPKQTKEALFTRLYMDAFPAVAKYISSSGGNLEDARDVFQEALLIYYEKVIINQYEPKTTHKAYLLGIAKNIYLKGRERLTKTKSIENLEVKEEVLEEPVLEKLLLFLQRAGKKCMDLLQSFYYEKMSMTDLSEYYGFRNERSATVQKYKCLEKIREQIRKKSLTYEDFID
ncbi:MAG: sigma-70 family RNA polymerase sigma factor [Bacteroidota bacterium]